MSDPVTRTVHFMNSVHDAVHSVRRIKVQDIRSAFYSPKHFPKFLGTVMTASFFTGYSIMSYLHNRRIEVSLRLMAKI